MNEDGAEKIHRRVGNMIDKAEAELKRYSKAGDAVRDMCKSAMNLLTEAEDNVMSDDEYDNTADCLAMISGILISISKALFWLGDYIPQDEIVDIEFCLQEIKDRMEVVRQELLLPEQ